MKEAFTTLISSVGEDLTREGLVKTPERAARAFQDLTEGYQKNPEAILRSALFKSPNDGLIVVKDIEFHSLCEHHMLPFSGLCHIGYLPTNNIVGLSKFARLVDAYAKRLQMQEHLTAQIANTINAIVKPRGVGVIMQAEHLCMRMRGVSKQQSQMTTSVMFGLFESDASLKNEFLALTLNQLGPQPRLRAHTRSFAENET